MNAVANATRDVSALNSLAFLIAPVLPQEFADTYWTKSPLHVARQSESWYKDILTLNDVEMLMLNERLPVDLFRLIKDGEERDPASRRERVSLLGKTRATATTDTRELVASLSRGYTIEIDTAQRVLPKLTRFVDEIVAETRLTAFSRIYVTPRNAQGFRVHYDVPEAFTMQIAGTKRWTLYPRMHRYVSAAQYSFMAAECQSVGEPIGEFTLRPGDLLYVPSGMPHCASAETEPSVSAVIGLTPLRWFDLFDEMKERAMWEEDFREPIPTSFASDEAYEEALGRFRELLRSYVGKMNASEVVKGRLGRFLRGYPTSAHVGTLRECLDVSARPQS